MSPSDVVTMTSSNHVTADVVTTEGVLPPSNDSGNDTLTGRDETLAKVELAILSTILYMALLGNGVVLVVLKTRYQQLSRMQWFIAHLAVADLFVALFHVLPQLIWDVTVYFHGNDFLCRTVKLFQVVAMCASSFVLVMTAIDRYISICHPLTSQTLSPSRVHQMAAAAWLLSILFSLPQVFIFKLEEEDGGPQCYGTFVPGWGLQAYITYTFLVIYVIPCLLLTFCYGRICLKVWESIAFKELSSSFRHNNKQRSSSINGKRSFRLRVSFKRMQNRDSSDQQQCGENCNMKRAMTPPRKPPGQRMQRISTAKIRTVKMTLAVVLTYLFCWAPFFMFNMINVYGDISFEAPYMAIIMLLASLNSCTNPWIYMAFSGRMCPKRKGRAASRSYNTSTQITYACDALESTPSTTTVTLQPPRCVSEGKGQSVVLKDRRSSWRQLETIKS